MSHFYILPFSEEQVLRFVRPKIKDSKRGLIALVLKAYTVHSDNPRVIRVIVQILEVTLGYGESPLSILWRTGGWKHEFIPVDSL